MEIKIESKIGTLRKDCNSIYSFLSDCNHFQQFASNNKIKDWCSDSDSCSFAIDGIGSLTFRIVERRPAELIKFSIVNKQAEDIFLWIQMKSSEMSVTRIKLTTKLEVSPMLSALISKPLKAALDKVVETLESICN